MPENLETAGTPALVLSEERLARNITRGRERARALGVHFRPHFKTCKSLPILDRLLDGLPGMATVSTLAEAEAVAAHGVADIIYAVAIAPDKLPRAARIRAEGADLKVLVDSVATARAAAAFQGDGAPVPALIEIDCDGKRAGVDPTGPELLEIARALVCRDPRGFAGILTHAGASYAADTADAAAQAAESERAAVTTAAARLRAEGIACPIVSVGATPSVMAAHSLTGVTEIRPGTFVFQDLVMAGLGVCGMDDIAVAVLTQIIAVQPARGRVIVDAGWMALSRDRGTADQPVDQHYGVVADVAGRRLDDLFVMETSQEHGIVAPRPGAASEAAMARLAAARIGDRLLILPNHACATAAQHTEYLVYSGDGAVCARYPRVTGW